MKCPHCSDSVTQVKIGFTKAGSQRYKCKTCNRKYTPTPKRQGYTQAIRVQAIKMYMDGNNQRRVARQLGISQGSVSNWHREYAEALPEETKKPDAPVAVAELDELFTFIGDKKTGFTS